MTRYRQAVEPNRGRKSGANAAGARLYREPATALGDGRHSRVGPDRDNNHRQSRRPPMHPKDRKASAEAMMASLGLGCIAGGGLLLSNAGLTGAAQASSFGDVGAIIPALPGLLILCGTALLGVALIRIGG